VTAGSRRFLILAAALALLVLPGTSDARPAGPAEPAHPSTGSLRICTSCPQTGGNLAQYGYVILNSWDAPMIPTLKAQNPGLKVLEYKNLTFTNSDQCRNGQDLAYLTTGVGYCDADQHHPDWFLTDPSGNRLSSSGYPDAWMMDVGNPGYQATWLTNVLADLHAGGWDGVFMDDTDADMSWHLNGRTIAQYPTSAQWRAATRSMLAGVGPQLRAAGFLAVSNMYTPWASDYDAHATWSDWLQFVSGASQEYYSKWGTGSSGWFAGNDWTYRQQFQVLTEQAGKIFLGITYAPHADSRSMTYARANFLLFDDPANGGALMFEPSDPEAQDPYAPSWTQDIGSPAGARFQSGSAWRRNYSGGTVVVNPTTSTVTVELGQTYLDANGTPVTSVTLGPTTGAVLTSDGSPPPPPPPPAPPPGGITLDGSVSGTSVSLTWSGMSSSRADVYRNGRRVATVANTGAYVDALSRHARGTYSYRVCAAGTSTCSNTVSVTVGSNHAADRLKARRAGGRTHLRLRRYARAAARRR
jgi:putative glycosyl hydrolase-like family 15 (GHL15) protein